MLPPSYCGYHYRVSHCHHLVVIIVMTWHNWHFPPRPSSTPEGCCTAFWELSKTISLGFAFSAIMAQLFFCPFFGNVFQFKDDLMILGQADKNKLRGHLTARGNSVTRNPSKMEKKILLSSQWFWLFLFLTWGSFFTFPDLILPTGGFLAQPLLGKPKALQPLVCPPSGPPCP